jgi:phenylpyruvate tautomerase PptA (4-oxalocrotonate tautomerase family)
MNNRFARKHYPTSLKIPSKKRKSHTTQRALEHAAAEGPITNYFVKEFGDLRAHEKFRITDVECLMPLVNISIPKGKSPEYIKAIADGVNAAVLSKLKGFPPDDRYQIIHELAGNDLEFQDRTEDRVMMYLVMRSGQTAAAKKAFYKQVVENLSRNPGIDPANVLIAIVENHDIDWSFRDGVAQFVP